MNVLLISDRESEYLWDYYQPGRLKGVDLILSCGDLDSHYLSFLVTMAGTPLLYVHGNHDKGYLRTPPEGCECIEDKLVTVKGLRVLGLGGSIQYNGGPFQYTEAQMARRIQRLRFQLWRAGGVDIVIAHNPARGYGDGEDRAHKGFACMVDLIDRYHPRYFVHGHVHASYVANLVRTRERGETKIINAYERYLLEIPDGAAGENGAEKRRRIPRF